MQRSLSELKTECFALGVPVKQTGKRESKDDYISALQKYNLSKKTAPLGQTRMLELGEPMLCFAHWHLKDSEQDDLAGGKWISEEKFNGVRIVLYWNPAGEVLEFYSRNISMTDYLPVGYEIYVKDKSIFQGLPEMMIDCELIADRPNVDTRPYTQGKNTGQVTETQLAATTAILALDRSFEFQQKECHLNFTMFDIPFYAGWAMKAKSLQFRRATLERVSSHLFNSQFRLSEWFKTGNHDELFQSIVDRGGEGLVYKHLDSTYMPGKRSRLGWIKRKRKVSDAGQDIDGFVTGFNLGDPGKAWEYLVGDLEISIWMRMKDGTKKEHKIARVSNLELEIRKTITVKGADGKLTLDPSWYGKVFTVEGQAVSARVKRLTHARIVVERLDKSPEKCVYDEELVDANVL